MLCFVLYFRAQCFPLLEWSCTWMEVDIFPSRMADPFNTMNECFHQAAHITITSVARGCGPLVHLGTCSHSFAIARCALHCSLSSHHVVSCFGRHILTFSTPYSKKTETTNTINNRGATKPPYTSETATRKWNGGHRGLPSRGGKIEATIIT